MFDSLWIDKQEAAETLEKLEHDPRSAASAGHLRDFMERGYCIIPHAVPVQTIDKYLSEYSAALKDDLLKASFALDVFPAKGADLHKPLTKILDTYVHCKTAFDLSFAPPIKAFLDTLFGEEALAFQGLHFEVGSTQAVHQDTAYVVVNEPKSLAASWIALEDVQPGAGELIYYPGSHRFGDFVYSGHRKSWSSSQDGAEIHNHHLHWLHEEAKKRGVALENFLPKKGSALMWHADLAHGGGEITRPDSTRRSLVTHYCPARCTPHYFRFLDVERQIKTRVPGRGYASTFYY